MPAIRPLPGEPPVGFCSGSGSLSFPRPPALQRDRLNGRRSRTAHLSDKWKHHAVAASRARDTVQLLRDIKAFCRERGAATATQILAAEAGPRGALPGPEGRLGPEFISRDNLSLGREVFSFKSVESINKPFSVHQLHPGAARETFGSWEREGLFIGDQSPARSSKSPAAGQSPRGRRGLLRGN